MSTLPGVLQVLVVIFGFMLQVSWCRYMSMSLNFSMAMSDERHAPLSLEVIRQCMRSTELSMADLQRFRHSLSSNDQYQDDDTVYDDGADQTNADEDPNKNDTDNGNDTDTDTGTNSETGTDTDTVNDNDSSPLLNDGDITHSEEIIKFLDGETLTDHRDQSLHCFTHCLYEKLGVIKNDFVVEEVVYRKLLAMLAHQDRGVPECNRLGSANKCEATYKLHMCYNRLKFLEAERRIRRILESKDFYANEDAEHDDDGGMDFEGDDDRKGGGGNGGTITYYDDDNGDTTPDTDISTNEIENS